MHDIPSLCLKSEITDNENMFDQINFVFLLYSKINNRLNVKLPTNIFVEEIFKQNIFKIFCLYL